MSWLLNGTGIRVCTCLCGMPPRPPPVRIHGDKTDSHSPGQMLKNKPYSCCPEFSSYLICSPSCFLPDCRSSVMLLCRSLSCWNEWQPPWSHSTSCFYPLAHNKPCQPRTHTAPLHGNHNNLRQGLQAQTQEEDGAFRAWLPSPVTGSALQVLASRHTHVHTHTRMCHVLLFHIHWATFFKFLSLLLPLKK